MTSRSRSPTRLRRRSSSRGHASPRATESKSSSRSICRPPTANGRGGVRDATDAVVAPRAAGADLAQQAFHDAWILSENVKGERARQRVDEGNHLLTRLIGEDREHRPKDLFPHDIRAGENVAQQGGGDEAVLFAENASRFDTCAAFECA